MTNLKRKARAWDNLQRAIARRDVRVVNYHVAGGVKYEGLDGWEHHRMLMLIENAQLQTKQWHARYEQAMKIIIDQTAMQIPPIYILKESNTEKTDEKQ